MNQKDCKHDHLLRIMGPINADRRTKIGEKVGGLMRYECEGCGMVFKFKIHVAWERPKRRE